MSKPLTPLVDFARTFKLEQFDPTVGGYVPVDNTVGTAPTCYIALTPDAATPADPSLTGTAQYIGGIGGEPAGTWFFGLDAAVLTFAKLDALFLSVNGKTLPAYFILLKPSGIRVSETLKYVRVQKAVAA
jgi:hypothetical protein